MRLKESKLRRTPMIRKDSNINMLNYKSPLLSRKNGGSSQEEPKNRTLLPGSLFPERWLLIKIKPPISHPLLTDKSMFSR